MEKETENIRMGAPYDNPAFEALCREMSIWGTAQAALCAVFWRKADAVMAESIGAGGVSALVRPPGAAQVEKSDPVAANVLEKSANGADLSLQGQAGLLCLSAELERTDLERAYLRLRDSATAQGG